jgi:cobalt/nickel transport system permease protein
LLRSGRNWINNVHVHVPDGFFDAPTSIATGLIAAGAVGVSLQRANREIRETGPALAGLTAAFVFAVQMVNFPVGAGTSGHLLGGALAAALVGPWTAVLVMSTVLLVQGLLFADGGLTALGLNIFNMALLGTAAGYLLIAGLLRLLPKTAAGVATTAFVASVVSVVVASQGFVLEYWMGGTTQLSLGTVAAAMAGVHTLIGIGEGIIAATTVATVARVRPDLVYALRRFRTTTAIRTTVGATA